MKSRAYRVNIYCKHASEKMIYNVTFWHLGDMKCFHDVSLSSLERIESLWRKMPYTQVEFNRFLVYMVGWNDHIR